MSPYDECEIFGVWDPTGNCAHTVYYSLFVFQHWGQGPCSIAVIRDRELTFCKDMGLVGVVFSPEWLRSSPPGSFVLFFFSIALTPPP